MESSQKEEGFSSEETIGGESKKRCSGCKTTKTPLWRSGPSGPKSLCNACGIRYRKKRPSPCAAASEAKQGKLEKSRNSKVRVNLVPLGKDVEVTEGQRSALKKPRQWGEVERAALLLMALSCGAVFA